MVLPKADRKVGRIERSETRHRVLFAAVALLLLKIYFSILWEYRLYFPADFDSAFLSGRRYSFHGTYRIAFYIHIISGPIAIALGCVSMLRNRIATLQKLHRVAGRLQVCVTVLVLLPSGLVMATRAYAGPIAGMGFACLSIATAVSVIMAAVHARRRNFVSHQRWAVRTFILLLSPLVLRAISGVLIVTGLESEETYQMNAWISWLLPLSIHQWSCFRERKPIVLGTAFLLLPTVIGCSDNRSPGPIETDGAEFLTADDYAAYDEQIIEQAKGQKP